MIHVVPLHPTLANSWDAYVLAHPQGTPFHLLAWKAVVERSFGHRPCYWIAQESRGSVSRTVGVLPAFVLKSPFFGCYVSSVPFAEKGGPLADNSAVAEALLQAAVDYARSLNLDYVELRNERPLKGLPVKERYVTFRKEMAPDPEKNLNAIPRKSRRMVRVGLQAGLRSRTGRTLLPTFYAILATNFHRLGTPVFSYRYFRTLVDAFGEAAEVRVVYTAEGRPIAGVISLFYQNVVMPYYAGSLVEYRHLAPNDFMYYDLMRWACTRGYLWFDFGRSKIETGSYAFKKHWGFEPKPLPYQYVLLKAQEIPDLSPANPKYQRRIKFWRRLPHWVTRLAGPSIARFLA